MNNTKVVNTLKSIKNTFETFNYNGEFREELNALTIAIQKLDEIEGSEEE